MRLKILPLSNEYELCCGCSTNVLKPNERYLVGSHCNAEWELLWPFHR